MIKEIDNIHIIERVHSMSERLSSLLHYEKSKYGIVKYVSINYKKQQKVN